ncbi:MAG: hypothetical protein LBI29_00775 [Rickettsiales bacterium]|jgi:hypothetical protein|nr:hypothetical protein [Rickettsiales bacterium]
MEKSVFNEKKDGEIFDSTVRAYVDIKYPGKYKDSDEMKAKLVKEYVESGEIMGIVYNRPALDLNYENNVNFTIASRVPDYSHKSGTREITPVMNKERWDLVNNGVGFNVIFVLGVDDDGIGGYHWVAARVTRDPQTGEIFLLHRDSKYGNVDEEFKMFAEREFGSDVRIVNVKNQTGVMLQKDSKTCGLRALTSMAKGGLFDRMEKKIVEKRGLDNFIESNTMKLSVTSPKVKSFFRAVIHRVFFAVPIAIKNFFQKVSKIFKSAASNRKKEKKNTENIEASIVNVKNIDEPKGPDAVVASPDVLPIPGVNSKPVSTVSDKPATVKETHRHKLASRQISAISEIDNRIPSKKQNSPNQRYP